HRCHRCNTETADVAARIKARGYLHDGVGPRRDLEVISTGHALAIQGGIDIDFAALASRLLDPELAEAGELLAFRRGGVHGEATRGNAVEITATKRTEIARTKE